MGYALSTTIERAFDDTVEATRTALSDEGFGILTEIDVQATLKAKLDADVPPQVILGACRPPLALAALQAEPSIGVLLPCSVAVRAVGDNRTAVEALDPSSMVELTGNDALAAIAAEARTRIAAALQTLAAAGA